VVAAPRREAPLRAVTAQRACGCLVPGLRGPRLSGIFTPAILALVPSRGNILLKQMLNRDRSLRRPAPTDQIAFCRSEGFLRTLWAWPRHVNRSLSRMSGGSRRRRQAAKDVRSMRGRPSLCSEKGRLMRLSCLSASSPGIRRTAAAGRSSGGRRPRCRAAGGGARARAKLRHERGQTFQMGAARQETLA
jgi:hypothetical protein